MRTTLLALAGTTTAALVAVAGPALAHVTVNPNTLPGGGYSKLTFRVPTEMDNASTTKVQVFFPADHPFGEAAVQPVPGWTFKVTDKKLATPITTDDGQVTEAVSQITWTADSAASAIHPGEFNEFNVSLGPLPDSGSLVFKALQTYSNGQVVRWIEQGSDAEHPAPVLTLTPATDASDSADAAATASSDGSDSKSGWALGLSGLAVVIAAGGTLLGLRRRQG